MALAEVSVPAALSRIAAPPQPRRSFPVIHAPTQPGSATTAASAGTGPSPLRTTLPWQDAFAALPPKRMPYVAVAPARFAPVTWLSRRAMSSVPAAMPCPAGFRTVLWAIRAPCASVSTPMPSPWASVTVLPLMTAWGAYRTWMPWELPPGRAVPATVLPEIVTPSLWAT